MPVFGNEQDLIARLSHTITADTARPVAVLCGAGLTQPYVPGARAILQLLRKGLEKEDQADLDEKLEQFELDSGKYQAAFQFLSFRRPPDFRDQVVRSATLRACKIPTEHRLSGQELSERESQIDEWNLTEGVAALGRMWAGMPRQKRGPILTTNFDPLVEISVRKAGGQATTYIQVDDSSFLSNLRVQTGASVVHLHGYWRESSTMHTTAQLEVDRPSVASAIREILAESTLLVIGYGAWSDIFTKQLANIVESRVSSGVDVDILWCEYESGDQLKGKIAGNDTLGALAESSVVQIYEGIDVNRVLPELERKIANVLVYPDTTRSRRTIQSVVGWASLSVEGIDIAETEDAKQYALSFFDGRIPNWADIGNPYIPIRADALGTANYIAAKLTARQSTMRIVIGPSGEGKSTLLRQVAYELLRRGNQLSILFHEGEQIASVEALLDLPADKQHLLIVDDADAHVAQLEKLVDLIHQKGRRGIHVLAASRDTDWRRRGGFQFNWTRHIDYSTLKLSGLSRADAESIVSSWESIGIEALRDLARFSNHDDRVNALFDASVRGKSFNHAPEDGSLLGSFLEVRYGDGLVEYIRLLMSRLSDQFVMDGDENDVSLLEALVAIALPHANGVYSLTFDVLAAYLGVEEPTLLSRVLGPLGEEAAVSYSSNRAAVRHSAIAAAVCDLAIEYGIDLENVCAGLVSAAARLISRGRYSEGAHEIAYLSRRLRVHLHLRVPAARAATTAVPTRLSYWTTLSAALRDSDDPKQAIEVNKSVLAWLRKAEDPQSVRGFLTEWGVCEGVVNHLPENILLAGLALSDYAWLERLTSQNAVRSLSCVSHGLWKAHQVVPDAVFLDGMLACARFAMAFEESGVDSTKSNSVMDLLKQTGLFESMHTLDLWECGEMLARAVKLAKDIMDTPLPREFPYFGEVRFLALIELAGRNLEGGWISAGR